MSIVIILNGIKSIKNDCTTVFSRTQYPKGIQFVKFAFIFVVHFTFVVRIKQKGYTHPPPSPAPHRMDVF